MRTVHFHQENTQCLFDWSDNDTTGPDDRTKIVAEPVGDAGTTSYT